ncbi:hypothetical protein BVI2075_720007 [Burkholderia vietnamiensis]|nr:hypothetical protein BVI2075_720007 [Burkholderia vietnamiensis]
MIGPVYAFGRSYQALRRLGIVPARIDELLRCLRIVDATGRRGDGATGRWIVGCDGWVGCDRLVRLDRLNRCDGRVRCDGVEGSNSASYADCANAPDFIAPLDPTRRWRDIAPLHRP